MAKVSTRKWTHNGVKNTAYAVRYTAPDGSRPSKQFEKKKDAERFRQKIEAEIAEGVHVLAADALTIKACCQAFIENACLKRESGKIGESRLRILKTAINLHIVPHLGARRLKDLTWADLEEWQRRLHKLAPRTRESYLTVFKMVEDYAIKRGHMKKPVVREFRRDAGSAKVAPIRTFNAEQAAALLRIVLDRPKGQVHRVHELQVCTAYLAACCGLRFGEIMGLTLDSVDFDRGVLRVRHNLTAWDELKGPKTSAGRRDVPMPARIGQILRAWIDQNYVPNDRGLIFRSRTGHPLIQANFKANCWYPLLKRAGLWDEGGDQFHFHALRHFAASWMIEHGLALPDVASLMGHSKFDMTLQVYAHPIVGGHRRHEAFERMTGSLIESAKLLPSEHAPTP